MKAIIHRRYGPPEVFELAEVDKPAPADNEVLIKVRAASINPIDRVFRGTPYAIRIKTGLRKPKDPRVGIDVAGEVEAAGRSVTQFKAGDAVFGSCRGAFAEYACATEQTLAAKPANVTFEQAASVRIAAITALQGLRDKGKIQRGQKVIINGASGGVGTFAVQIARAFGADVTGVCSTRNAEMVRSIGADHVIDYTREDFTKGAQHYDLIFDAVGNHSLSALRRVLSPNGTCVLVGARSLTSILVRALKAPLLSRFTSQKFVMLMAKSSKEDMNTLRDLLEAGKMTPVIDRRYRLSEVPDAMRYLEEGHARGKIVITL